jgi:hypothetical protein
MEINGSFGLLKKIGTQNGLRNVCLQERMGKTVIAKMKLTVYKLPRRNVATIGIDNKRS